MHSFPCRCQMMLQLPLELWDVIADCVDLESVSQVCHRLGEILWSGRDVKLHCNADEIAERVLEHIGNLGSLQVQGVLVADSEARASAELKEALTLHTLTLNLGSNMWGLRGIRWHTVGHMPLLGLKEAPSLHTLTLDL